MNKLKISFIGGGNMTEGFLGKAIKSNVLHPENTMVCDIHDKRLSYLKSKYKVNTTLSASHAVKYADIVIFAVKPQHFLTAIDGIHEDFADKAIISIMAGWTTEHLKNHFHKTSRVLRVMPNAPALVGEGMTVLCEQNTLKVKELEFAKCLFDAVGEYIIVKENFLDVMTGLSGSGPAYVYIFIEALSDAGVYNGMPRDLSYKVAAQTVLGAAKMVLETDIHPGALKDMVCTPGGTTIEAVASLEKNGFRNAVIRAVNACTAKSRKMSDAE